MNLSIDGAFIYFTIPIFGGINVTQTTLSLVVVTAVLCTAFVLLGKDLKKDKPSGRQVIVELGVGMLRDMVAGSMGEHNLSWMPFIGTIFLSSLMGSLMGLTGFLRSSTADLSTVLTWAIMVSVIIWYNNIKNNGFVGWLKGFTEPVVVMTPMNIISEIAQPIAMAFRHFGNVAGGGVITMLLYTALSAGSVMLLNLIAASGPVVSLILLVLGAWLLLRWRKKKKLLPLVFGIISAVLGFFGLLQVTGILTDVPILAYGIPAVLSCYFDLFSGFIQAYVFTLLTMVYIAGSLPGPEET